ncbi:TetR/AcrR family transcriptional regulator [Robinsoniella sp. KNHs210]|uniref:TetR/AcrR family transcriptional regulator n=1 Tax=Robinsoniella sp. KNHs210 TaxID=1469950 RepID=UPI0018CC59E6|nr:TetR/AcrR family transcriptional regulator [Robinsoniella sp. KNHs210]
MNVVQDGGERVNRVVTSREELIKAAKAIVFEEGADKLNIRYLAKKCGIATGSVYNYFPSKSELIFAVVEEFWKTIFHQDVCKMQGDISFVEFFETVYLRLCANLQDFRSIFMSQFEAMKSSEKEKGRMVEQKYLEHVQDGFLIALGQDKKISDAVWTDTFTKEKFVAFLFTNMFSMLTDEERDCSYFKEVLNRILYII